MEHPPAKLKQGFDSIEVTPSQALILLFYPFCYTESGEFKLFQVLL
jgi:hypothetical protein